MRFIRSTLATGIVLLAATVAAAQGSGGIEVIVVDSDGGPLPGATVTISHETGFVKTSASLTDKRGSVVFPVLRPGSGYAIHVSFPGFAPVRHDELRVSINSMNTLNVQLSSEIVERVKVTAKRNVIDLESTETAARFSEDFISDLPVPGRFYQNVLTMAPGVNDANNDGNPNVHGSRDRDFAAMVGGVRNVDPLTGQFMSQINPNSIEEIEVIAAGAGVEFGRAQGGFARIIQKQGNNEHEGTFDFLYQSSILDGTGAANFNNVDEPDFSIVRPGISLSGPVLRDKLWYYLSTDYAKNEDPVNTGNSVDVMTTTRWTHAHRLTWQVSPRNKLSFQFQSDPLLTENVGVSSTRPPETTSSADRTSEQLTVTWTAPYSPKILVESVASYQDLNTQRTPNSVGIDNSCAIDEAGVLNGAQCVNLETGETSGSFPTILDDHRQRFTLSGKTTIYGGRFWGMSHQFRVGVNVENERYFRDLTLGPRMTWLVVSFVEEDPTGENPEGNPQSFGLAFLNISVPEQDDVRATGTNWGIYAEDQFKPAQNLTITFGVRVDREEIVSEGRSPVLGQEEFQEYSDIVSPWRSIPGMETNASGAFPNATSHVFPNIFTGYEDYPGFEAQLKNVLCANDPNPGNCNAKVDQNLINQAQNGLTFRRQAQGLDIQNTNFSPALSLAWSPGSNGKTAIKAAVGRHYNSIPLLVPLQELQPAQAVLRYRSDLTGCGIDGREACGAVLENGIQPTITIQTVDPDIRTPYQDEFTFSVERELWTETSLSLTYINRKFRDQIQDVNTNLDTGDFGMCVIQRGRPTTNDPTPWIAVSPGSGQTITNPYNVHDTYIDTDPGAGDGRLDDCVGEIETLRVDPNSGSLGESNTNELRRPDGVTDLYVQNPFWGDIFLIGNYNSIDYQAAVLELVRRQYRNWEMRLSYTWSEAIGDGEDFFQELGDDPSLKDNQTGFQSYDQRHVVKVQGTTITPWGIRLGTNVTWNSGLPYSLLLEERSFDTLPTLTNNLASTTQRNRQSYPTGVRNDQRNTSYWNVDLRITKEFNLGRGLNMQLSADILNALNDGTRIIWDPVQQVGTNVNGINRGTRFRFGRAWQLGMKLNW